MTTLILIMLFLPVTAAALMLVLDAHATPGRARWFALTATIATMLLSWLVAAQLPAAPIGEPGPVTTRWEWRHTWVSIPQHSKAVDAPQKVIELEFFLGMDGLSLAMILLTTGLCVSAVLVSWKEIQNRPAEFYAGVLILESGLIGVFLAYDLMLFYAFFEFTLLPLFLTIGVWGGPRKRYAAAKFFIYTLAGSLIMLLGLVSLVAETYSVTGISKPFAIPDMARALAEHPLASDTQALLFLLIATGFFVKVPMFPFHTWLPLVHVEAPTAGSIDLAGVLLKLGCFGFLRIAIPMLPDACIAFGQPTVAALGMIGVVYGSLCALAQPDIKRLVAYSSIAHLGVCMMGLFALNTEGLSGGFLMMINHGITSGILFSIVGMIHERYHTRSMNDLGGLAQRLPLLASLLVFAGFASAGLPGLNGFVGELLSLLGMFQFNMYYAAVGTTGIILGAWYILSMLQKALFGPLKEPAGHNREVRDLSVREGLALAPLLGCCLWLGLYPEPLISLINPDVKALTTLYQKKAEDKGIAAADAPEAPKNQTAPAVVPAVGEVSRPAVDVTVSAPVSAITAMSVSEVPR